MWAFEKRGFEIPYGMDLLLFGNIPNGSGLSSSASVEVLTGFILRDMFGFDVTNQDLALIGQYSENNFNGVNCGIMDQFAIAMGKKDHAIFLDTAAVSYTHLRAHETRHDLVCRLLLEKKKKKTSQHPHRTINGITNLTRYLST